MAGKHRGPNKNQRTTPVKKTTSIQLTLEPELHTELYLTAYREQKSLALMASVLVKEALATRSAPPEGCDCGTPGKDPAVHSEDCSYRF